MKNAVVLLLMAGLLLAGCSSQSNSSPAPGQGSAPQQETPQNPVQATTPAPPSGVVGPAPDPQLLGSIDSTAQDLNSGIDGTAIDDNWFLQIDNSSFQ